MTAVKAHEVVGFIARAQPDSALYLIYGPDAGLVRETGQRLLVPESTNSGSSKDKQDLTGPTDLTILDMEQIIADPGRLAIEARTPSLFGGVPRIRLRNATNALARVLPELLDDLPTATIVIEAGNLTPREKLRVIVEKSANAFALPCYPDNAQSLSRLISDTLAAHKVTANMDTISLLRDTLGNDREISRRELEKLTIFASQSKQLTQNDIMALCGDNTSITMDQIADATGTGHAQKLEIALNRAFSAGTDSQRILAVMINHFHWLREARSKIDAGKTVSEVFNTARPRPHFSRKSALEQQLRLWTSQSLSKAATRIYQASLSSRQQSLLAPAITRRALLGVCIAASQR